jgi:superfamily I DNA/RNA helicase/RecB family exonuclease
VRPLGTSSDDFDPGLDPGQARVLAHRRGTLLITGASGTGKTVALRERFARLVEEGADPERVALVTRSRRSRADARRALLQRLHTSLPGLRVLTVHGLAFHVVAGRAEELGYDGAPKVLTAAEQYAHVRDLLRGEDPAQWPAYRSMLGLRGFADQVRQFLLRAQESLLQPEDFLAKAQERGLSGWKELASFYRRYLQVLDAEGAVDFAGLLMQAAAVAAKGEPELDHLLVDDFQDSTFATEALLGGLRLASLAVAGDADAHVFSFQGTTNVPLLRFDQTFPGVEHVELSIRHRGDRVEKEAWFSAHTSEEHAAIARELRRIHAEEEVRWRDLAVVVRRQGGHLGSVLRALDDAAIPRSAPDGGLVAATEPATYPYLLALRWLAFPEDRDDRIEALLTSELGRIPPAKAFALVRVARAAGEPAAAALARHDDLDPEEISSIDALRSALERAEPLAERSVVDAFSVLWKDLPSSRRLVDAAGTSREAERDLDAVLAFADAIASAGARADASVAAFLDTAGAADEGVGTWGPESEHGDAVQILTAHGAAGEEFDTVVVAGAVEGDFPSLSRPEPMFDLQTLDRTVSQSERNRQRLEDERRLFRLVVGRARRRVLFTGSDPHGQESSLSAPSRFVQELGVDWTPARGSDDREPLTVAEASAGWRMQLADVGRPAPDRLAALEGLVALGVDPDRWWFQRDWTDPGRPLHERLRVSYSRLDKLENCELQYVLGEELGLETRSGYHAWVGHLVHRLIEDCENDVIPRELDALIAAADERWRRGEFPSYAVSEAFRRLVTGTMLPAWFAEYGAGKALGQETHFEFPFADATVSGKIDRIGPAGTGVLITDYKTGKARNAADADENLQLGIYSLAVKLAEELAGFGPVKAVELAFLRDKDRDTGSVKRTVMALTSDAGPAYEEEMSERLGALIGQLYALQISEEYRANPAANCRFCTFKSLCPLWPEGAPLFPEQAQEQVQEVGA